MSDAIDDYAKENDIAGGSIIKFIRYLVECKGSVIATEGAMILLKAATVALNVAFAGFVTLLATKAVSAWQNYIQRTENAVKKSQEAVQKANQLKSSLKDISESYEKLGDKASWDTSDFDQAKDIQEELLELLKDQDGISKDRIDKIDLQNGKYEEQLELLRQIRLEQLQGETSDLVQNKDNQGKLLEKVAKEQAHDNHSVDSFDSEMAKELANRFGWDYNEDSGVLNFNNYDPDDADSVVGHYNELSQALDIITKKYSDADRAASGLYDAFKNDRAGIKDQVDAYNDAVSALKQNQFKSDFAEWSANETKKSTQATAEIDAKIKATKEYQDAVKEAEETEKEWNSQGYGKYGNIDNFHRDKIDWTDENLAKYKDFVDEQNSIFPGTIEKGSYSTVLGSWDTLSDEDGTEHPFAFTPMLQTDDGLVPLTEDQLWNYIDTIVEQCYDKNGKLDIDKLMQLDATGLDEDINGVMMRVKGMIAGIEGAKDPNGGVYSAADVLAQSGDSNEDIKNDLIDLYGPDADLTPVDDNGNLSRYVDKSMHDAQAVAQEGKDNIEAVYDQLYNDLENGSSGESDGSSSAPVRYVDHIKSAFDILADSLGKDSGEMTISDVVGLSQDGVQLTDEQAQALDTLTAAANKYGTTIQGVAEAGEENGLFGGIEDAQNGIAAAAQEMDSISKKIDEIQSAYKACTTAMDEYNKYGYMSADALQGLLSISDEYLACLDVVDGKLQINNDRYADLIATQYTEAETTAIEQAVSELNALQKEDAKEKTEGLTTATEEQQTALENAVPAIKDATVATGDLAVALAAAQGAAEGDEAMQAKIETVTNALNTRLTAIHTNMQAALSSGAAVRNQLKGFDKDTKKNGSSASKSVTDVASAFDTLTKAMKEYNQYGYISADTMKSMMKLEDKFTSCLVKNGDKLEINANEFRKLVETQLKEEEANGKASKSADELKRVLSYLDSNVHSSTISFEQLTDVIKGYGTAMDDAKEKTDAIKSAFSGLYDVGTKKKDNDFGFLDADSIEKKYQAIRDLYDKTDLFTNPAYKDALNSETGEIDYNSDAFKQMFADHLAQLATSARETGGEAGKYLAQGFEDAAAKISQNVISIREYIDGIGSSLKYATDRIDHFQSGFSDISDIVKEYNTYGGLSIDNYQKLMSLDDDYIKCLSLEGNQLKFNTEEYKKLFIAKLNAMADEYDKAKETQALAARLRELAEAVGKSADGFTMATDSAKNFEDTLSNIKSLLSDLIGVFEQFNTDKSNDLKIQGDAWLEVIDKRIDALNEQNDAQERAIELSKAQDALEKAKANKTVHVYHAGGSGFEWEADENAVRDAQSTLNDTIRKNRKEDEIERLKKLKKAVQENNELIGSSFEDYEKKKKYLAEFDKMTYDDMISYNENWKNSIISNMKSTQVVTNINEIVTKIEKLVTTLETLNNVLTWITTLGKSTDGGGLTGLFSSGGLFSKIGKFFNIASEEGLGAALNQTGEWFSGKLSAALEANPNNPIIKAFSNLWTAVGEGASNFFTETSGTGLGGIIKTGIEKAGTLISGLGGSEGVLGTIATTVKTGIGSIGTALSGGSSAIPVIGPLIAVAVNNAVQQFGKISKENTKIWADQNSTTGEKIASSVGNVLYHLSPVEGWDKSVQYAWLLRAKVCGKN